MNKEDKGFILTGVILFAFGWGGGSGVLEIIGIGCVAVGVGRKAVMELFEKLLNMIPS